MKLLMHIIHSVVLIFGLCLVAVSKNSYSDTTLRADASKSRIENPHSDRRQTIRLNGSRTTPKDGLVKFEWTIKGNVVLNWWYGDIELAPGLHEITLTVTDVDGDVDSDTVTFEVTERFPPGFKISSVTGHTAALETAKFSIALTSPPSDDVIINLSSSNISQGNVLAKEVVFTPYNWKYPQRVYVKGANSPSADLVQDYVVVLSPAVSEDAGYDGLNPDDIPMYGLKFDLLEPDTEIIVTPYLDRGWGIGLKNVYKGRGSIQYHLVRAPSGMEIDKKGKLTWKPTAAEEGVTFPVTVKASVTHKESGFRQSDNVSFPISVAKTRSIKTVRDGNTLTINDDSTNLNGLILRFHPSYPDEVDLRLYMGVPPLLKDVPTENRSDIFYNRAIDKRPSSRKYYVEVLFPRDRISAVKGTEWDLFGKSSRQNIMHYGLGYMKSNFNRIEKVNEREYVVFDTRKLSDLTYFDPVVLDTQ